jgi:5-methylcytosine-specific restriction enzyme A
MPHLPKTFRLGGAGLAMPRFRLPLANPSDDRPSAAVRGYDRRWQRIRGRILDAAPLCAECEARGMVVPATLVHHLRPLSAGGTHDNDNLQPLCGPCHAWAHGKGGR